MTIIYPENFNDNEIITADYWNSILGANGVLRGVEDSVNRRANCNVFYAKFTNVILGNTRITYNVRDNSSYRYFQPRESPQYISFGISGLSRPTKVEDLLFANSVTTNYQQVIQGTPFILICSFNVAQEISSSNPPETLLPFPNNYLLRTTVERDYLKTGSSTEVSTETIASNFFNIKNNDVGIGTISFNNSSNVVTGVSTKFGDGDVGRSIYVSVVVGGITNFRLIGKIASVTNATTAILEQNAKTTLSATNYFFNEMGRANITTSMCYASHSITDKYYITIAHSFSRAIRVDGIVRLIVNPGMV
jgi:hypothetical protein